MEVQFVDRASGWRQRGRPTGEADPAVVDKVRHAYSSATVAVVHLEATDTRADVLELMRQLRRAAEVLDKVLRIQPRRTADMLAAREIRFTVGDA